MVSHTSSASRLTTPLTSPDAYAVGELPDQFPLGRRAWARAAAHGPRAPAARRARVARARLSALATESVVAWRMPAVSARLKPSTSHSTTTARWRGGSSCSAVMNASEIASVAS